VAVGQEKRSLLLELLAKDKTAAATRSASDNLDDVADSAKDADRAAERFGKTGRTAAGHVEHLDREIEACERELKQLAVAFTEAETVADRADLSKAIRRTETDLKRLSRARGEIDDLIPKVEFKPEVGRRAGIDLVKSIGEGIGSAKGGLMAGSIAALAPEIGAVVAAGVVGAVGLGGVIGGLALAAKGPAAKQQATDIGKAISEGLQAEASTAFAAPLAKSLDELEGLAARSIPKVGKIFDETAPSVEGLTEDFERFTDGLLGGAVNAAQKSGPVMGALGDTLGDTGESLGNFLSVMAEHSDEAAVALGDVNDVLQDTITVATTVIDVLATVKGGFDSLDAGIAKIPVLGQVFDLTKKNLMGPLPILAELFKNTDELGNASIRALRPQAELAPKMDATTAAAKGEATALSDLATEIKAQSDPTFALIKAQDDLRAAKKGVNEAQDKYTKNSPEYRSALAKAAEAAIALESAAGGVATTSDGKLTPALKATLQAAGITGGKIDELERQFADAKKTADKFAKTYQAKVEVAGLAAAKATAARISATLAAIKDENVKINYQVNGVNSSRLRSNVDKNREFGGPVKGGHAYVVGEKRAEVFVPDRDGKILPSVEQYQRAVGMGTSMAAAPAGSAPVNVYVQAGYIVSPRQLQDQITEVVSKLRGQGRI
jgi:hypothetical protein